MLTKAITLFLLSSIKFIFAFPLAIKLHFTCLQTIVITSLGGVCGILFFIFFWENVIDLYFWFVHNYLYRFPKISKALKKFKKWYKKTFYSKKKKGTSYKRKRKYIWLKNNASIIGLAVLTPLILSIPIGTFLTVRFFGRSPRIILTLCLVLVIFSILFSCLIHYVGVRY
jgi:uncharacterized oligopeptide transporter (OPT) family protein